MIVLNKSSAFSFSSSESISSRARGLILKLREIFISSSTCSFVFDISLCASINGPFAFPPFPPSLASCLLLFFFHLFFLLLLQQSSLLSLFFLQPFFFELFLLIQLPM